VIVATKEAEIRRIVVLKSVLGKQFLRPYLQKNPSQKRAQVTQGEGLEFKA
jgi:hypothetical protein